MPDPHMNDPQDKDIHRRAGVDPYPVPAKPEQASHAANDEATSTPENYRERGQEREDGQYLDAVDRMKKTLKDGGDLEAWRDGRTQGAPDKT